MIDKNAILNALEVRFDYISARTVLKATLSDLNITDAPTLPESVIKNLTARLPKYGGQFQGAEARLNALLTSATPATPVATPAAEPAPQAQSGKNNQGQGKKKK